MTSVSPGQVCLLAVRPNGAAVPVGPDSLWRFDVDVEVLVRVGRRHRGLQRKVFANHHFERITASTGEGHDS